MKKIIRALGTDVLYYSGVNSLIGSFLSDKIFLVGYHSVFHAKNREELCQSLYHNISVSASDFEDQIIFLKKNGHTFIHFSDLKKPETKNVSKPTIVFFDDGFKDVLINALPILKRHGVPATVFLTTGLINQTHFLWTLGLRHFLSQQGMDSLDIEKMIAEYKRYSRIERAAKLKELYASRGFALNPRSFDIFLNWSDIRELIAAGIEIGSHSVSHDKLTELSPVELKYEMEESKKEIKEKMGITADIVSYPYGRKDGQVISAAKAAGYAFGVSTEVGINSWETLSADAFALRRLNPEESPTMADVAVCLYTRMFLS